MNIEQIEFDTDEAQTHPAPAFSGILFNRTEDILQKKALESEAPVFFVDLNLNQIIDAITIGKEEYNLKPFFYTLLTDLDTIMYRHEIMKDLENNILFDYIESFARNMREIRIALSKADECSYKYQKERLFLDSAEIYCEAIYSLAKNLSFVNVKSRGFLTFREYLTNYIQSFRFTSLLTKTKKLIADLSSVKYCVLTRELRVQVRPYYSETDYSEEVDQIFEKFKQEPVKDYRIKFDTSPEMNHVEASILDGVAILYPDIFQNLDDYFVKNANYQDETIVVFDREIQFYIAYLEYISTLKRSGLKFCYPEISKTSKEVYDYESFDLALAYKLIRENTPIVCNDFCMTGKERIIVVTGPNQGGKTTFARTFGQLHYLANIGCPVPGKKAKLFLFDKLFTHFEKEENIKNLRSKFEDDLVRIHNILNQATSNSIVIMNEILSSTTLQDSIFLSKKIMEKIAPLDVLCVWVTFIDELILLTEKTISMVSTVVPENPAMRTFKVVKRPADGLAYALSIAEKYRVTYNHLKERIKS
jgi:DNA mismatch repair protein MutS